MRKRPKANDKCLVEPESRSNERQALIKEIVDELRKDELKEEVLKMKIKPSLLSSFSRFLQHPVVLVVVGFALTGWIGGRLSNAWQLREWDRQQQRLIEIRSIDLKYEIINDVTKAVGERNAAIRGVMYPLFNFNSKTLKQDEVEPIKTWRESTHNWLIDAELLDTKITTHIRNKEAQNCLARMLEKEKEVTGTMAYVTSHLSEYQHLNGNDMKLKELDSVYDSLGRVDVDLATLIGLVVQEVQEDVKGTSKAY